MKSLTGSVTKFALSAVAALGFLSTAAMNPAFSQESVESTPVISSQTWGVYADSIVDSAVSRPGEVATDLLVPDQSDPRTQWREFNGVAHLLVQRVGWQAISTAPSGSAFTLPGNYFIAVPGEVDDACRKFDCRKLSAPALNLRMAQLLGMPPDADISVLSRFWVNPADMIRPCTNVEITVASCPQQVANTISNGVDWSSFLFTQGMSSWRTQRTGTKLQISCDADYKNTMNGNCYGFPWTRLGYTFDWNPVTKGDRGVTEFVVAQGSTVYFESAGTIRSFYPYRKTN